MCSVCNRAPTPSDLFLFQNGIPLRSLNPELSLQVSYDENHGLALHTSISLASVMGWCTLRHKTWFAFLSLKKTAAGSGTSSANHFLKRRSSTKVRTFLPSFWPCTCSILLVRWNQTRWDKGAGKSWRWGFQKLSMPYQKQILRLLNVFSIIFR